MKRRYITFNSTFLGLVVVAVAITGCGKSNNGTGTGGTGTGGTGTGGTGTGSGTGTGDGTGTGSGTEPLPHTLFAIAVTPSNTLLELDVDTPTDQEYSVQGLFLDGVGEDVTDQVTWEVVNPAVGTVTDGTLAIPGFASATVEVSRLKATLSGFSTEAQITVVAYRQTGVEQDYFFVLPYEDDEGNQERPLEFSTDVPAADLFFLMDTTGSMGGEISNLQASLQSEIVTGAKANIPDTHFGVGEFEDFPVDGYGDEDCRANGPDQPFNLKQTMTSDIDLVQTAVNGYSLSPGTPVGCGADGPESNIEALYQVATGEGLNGPGLTSVASNADGIGGVGFRDGTMPIVLSVTDATTHAVGGEEPVNECFQTVNYSGDVASVAHTRQQAKDALAGICAKVVGVASVSAEDQLTCTGYPHLEDFANSSGARVPPVAWDGVRPDGCGEGQCCTGLSGNGREPDADGLCPLVFMVLQDGTGLGAQAVTGIQMLTRFATFEVTTEVVGESASTTGTALASGTTADFITSVVPVNFEKAPAPPVLPDPEIAATTFKNVTPGTKVGFEVTAFNNFVESTDEAQIFRAKIRVLAGGCTDLDEREVTILVPPRGITIE